MQLINAPIKQSQTGSVAVNLIECILFLISKKLLKIYEAPNQPTQSEIDSLVEGAKKEMAAQVFGENAQRLVFYFQIQNGLGDVLRGLVDDKTAKFLNELLAKLSEPIESTYVVSGIITNSKTNLGIENLVVRAFDADGVILTALGQARTDSKGNYRVDFDSSAFRNTKAERGGPDLVVDIFDESGAVKLARSKRHNNSATTTVINLAIDIATLCVYGTVTNTLNQPQAKIIVTAWDRDLRKRQLLGAATTDEKGDYSIFYRNDQFAAADIPSKKTPWLVVEAGRDTNAQIEKSIELKPSETKPTQRVDIQLNVLTINQLTEWEEVTRLIKPLLVGQGEKGNDLSPNAFTPNDIQFLTTETNLDSNVINAWSDSYAIQQISVNLLSSEYPTEAALIEKFGWPLFYGLCRQLSVSSLQGLQSRSMETLIRAIETAQQQKQIPTVAKEDSILFCQCIECLRQLQQVQSDITNSHPIAQTTSVLGITVSTKIKLAALAILEKSGNENPDSLLSLHKEFPKDTQSINHFIQGMRLNQLANGNSMLMKSLNSYLSNEGDSIVSLAGLAVSDWNNVATQSDVSNPDVMVMLKKMELTYPVEAFESRIKNKQLTVMSGEITKGIQKLLRENPEKVRDYVQGRTRVLTEIDDAAEKILSIIGLFGRLGLPYEVGSDLIAANIDTPTAINKYGKETIIDLLKDKYGYDLATHFGDKTITTINDLTVVGQDVIVGAVQYQYVPKGWYIKPDQPSPEVRENIPSIPALLGDLDECICPPCESMLGQPAYLVDLLQLLNKQNAQGLKPLVFLRKRRSDIFDDLRLGCEQADTEVLHIDLAIEVMENAAIDRSLRADKAIALAALYKNIAHQLYPWFLPFDKQFASRTAYLSKLGINDYQLDELTQNQFDANQRAASVLGIPYTVANNTGSAEWTVLTQIIQGATLWKVYGFNPDAQQNVSIVDPASREALNNQPITQVILRISVLLDRTGLGLDDFEALIHQPYIGQLSIDNRAQCKTSQMHLNVGSHSLEICLDRIHRMVRLQRKLNWSFADINAALTMLGQSATLNNIIIQIAQIKLLADTSHLPISLLCQFPQSYGSILRALGIPLEQRLCLEKILAIDTQQSSFNLSDLKTLLNFNALMDETTLSIAELGFSLLTPDDLQSIFPVLPVQVLSEAELTLKTTQLVNALRQEKLQSSTTLTDAVIITLVASVLEIYEQNLQPYTQFKISGSQTAMQILHAASETAPTNLSQLNQWLNCIVRLESIRVKFDSAVFDALLNSFDWMSVIATQSAVRGLAIESLVNWLWLSQPERMGAIAIAEILNLSASNDASNFDRVLELFSMRFEVDATTVKALAALVNLSQSNFSGFKNAVLVKRFFNLLTFAKQWQSDSTAITTLTSHNIEPTIASIFKAKYGYTNDEWDQIKEKIENPIRQQKRDALVAELIRQNSQFKNAQDIYEYYLIDPLVEPCMNTTRILEAITATQLFAQRVLFGVEKYHDNLNLEQTLVASQALKDQWTWMRNYRVWEANRKVFLFPENWLYPELRDDKSSSFKLLESELGKGELDAELVNESFGKFVDDIAQMGQIQVLGMHEDDHYDIQQQTTQRSLYIVGRTPNKPYVFFWRKCTDFGSASMEWAPWRRIELEITSDHVVICLRSGRPFLVWPIAQQDTGSQKWNVDLAWSRFDGTNWQKPGCHFRNAAQANASFSILPFTDESSAFCLRVFQDNALQTFSVALFAKQITSLTSKQVEDEALPANEVLSRAGYSLTPHFLADLIASNVSLLPKTYQDLFDVYRTRRYVVEHNVASPFYTHLDIFGDPTAVPRAIVSLENNATERGWRDAYSATDPVVITNFIDSFNAYWQAGGPYANFVDEIFELCSTRLISYRLWVKVLDRGVPDLVEYTGNTKLNFEFNGIVLSLDPGEQYTDSLYFGTAPSATARLSWTGFNFPVSLPKNQNPGAPVVATSRGFKTTQCLHFMMDVSADSRYSPETFGVKIERSFGHIGTWRFATEGLVEYFSENSKVLPAFAENTEFYNNGYLEKETNSNNTGLSLHLRSLADNALQVFTASGSGTRFRLLPGTTASSNQIMPSTWYFEEGGDRCFIDVASFQTSVADVAPVLYPASWAGNSKLLGDWFESGLLPSGTAQTNSYGIERLPVANQSVMSSMPSEWLVGNKPFDNRLPLACYSWEIFFHAPLFIASQLTKQHQFEEAERWLRYVFDPTSNEAGNDATRFLKFRVFKELEKQSQVIDDLKAIAQAASGYYTGADINAINKIINRWRQLPFRPFAIARGRHIAFLWQTLFAYVDNLITWADSLYRRDTRESNNEALMLYVLANRILGRRPKQQNATSKKVANTYDELAGKLDAFSNYWVDVATRAGGYAIYTGGRRLELVDKQPPTSAGALLFCMPHNDKLDRYWDVIEERLFNLRHCRNIEGITRDLPLVDSPIDPELLVRATAAGLDLNSVIAGLYAAPPHYRYTVLASRATELIGETKSLGSAMLSALEKRDAEQLAQLRSVNELALLQHVSEFKKLQISEAEANISALRTSRKSSESRYNQYQRLLGLEMTAPEEGVAVGEVAMLGRYDNGNSSPRSGLGLITEEGQQYKGVEGANTWSTAATISKVVGAASHTAASIVLATPAAITPAPQILNSVADSASLIGDSFAFVSQGWKTYAEQQGMLAGHLRRRDEWAFQSNQVLKELSQIDKQILANQIRIDITKKELDNHQLQVEQSQAIDEVMRTKFTNVQLYEWMSKELYSLYNKAYRMALEMARKAQSAAERELGLKKGSLNLIQNDHWSSMKQGLLAGERFYQDLKRLDVAYLDQSKREFELTKHISLRRLNPQALNELRFKNDDGKNSCDIDLPEWLFDLDTPGHFLRRIKSVSISIPCVVGPYTNVNCKLTLKNSKIRYDRVATITNYLDSNHITDYPGASEAIVTSTANADSGLFETPLHDERFLPFEHSGVISSWQLELPDQFAQFDYSTISDVILTVRYTARDGGESLRSSAQSSITSLLSADESTNPKAPLRFPLLLSCRSDFPTEWAQAKTTNETLKISLKKDVIPYWFEAASINKIHSVKVNTLNGKNLTELADAVLSGVNGLTIADTNVQLMPTTPTDIFLLVELGKN